MARHSKSTLPSAEGALDGKAPANASEVSPHGTETILVVDDEDPVCRIIEKSLQTVGYRVLIAHGAPGALETYRTHAGKIDLIISDMVMPGMSGPDLVEQLARNGAAIRTLYISGYAERAVVRKGLMDPEAQFLQKPFGVAALRRKVREVLDSGRDLAA